MEKRKTLYWHVAHKQGSDQNDPDTWDANNAPYYYLFREIEGIQTYFGNFAPQSAGPLSNIKVIWVGPGNATEDGFIDMKDFAVFANCWKQPADYNNYDPTDKTAFYALFFDLADPNTRGDGTVDINDLGRFLNNYLKETSYGE